MADTDKRPEDIEKRSEEIIEETMQGIFEDINNDGEEPEPQEKAECDGETGQEDKEEKETNEENRDVDDPDMVLDIDDDSAADSQEWELEDDGIFYLEDEEDEEFEDDRQIEDELEDDEVFDEDESEQMQETEAQKELKRHRARKKVGIVIGAFIGALLLIYLGFAWFFSSHFLLFTKINGTDFSMKSVDQVQSHLAKQVDDYVLSMKEQDGGTETITGTDISLKYVSDDKLKKLVEKQNNFLWIESLWKKPEIKAEIGVEYDENKLQKLVGQLKCLVPENQTPSVDAQPQFQNTEFVIMPEVVGTQIDTEKFQETVKEAINGFVSEIDLTESDCYIKPRFLSDSPEVVAAKDAMNKYLGASVTYDFNPHTEVVDAGIISQWVKVDADMNVTFDEGAVRAFVQSLAEKYNTKGKTRTFVSGSGNTVTVEGGGYGWQIDQEAEYNALTANIQNAEVITREAHYASRAASHGENDFGGTYAEVDLTNQQIYFFRDGQVVLQSACVTGNPNKGNATPAGTFSLTYKALDQVLRGKKLPNGQYEYETPVKFWMPFNGGVGFHDATWQPTFGGSRYLTNGSHGCINLPYNVASELYNLISAGVPVIVHF